MTYATRNDLELRYGMNEIAQRESALPAGALDRALTDADALIDGYVSGRYSVPLSPVPPNVAQIACAIARHSLMGDAVTERARDDYTDAIAWLKGVASGAVTLQVAAPLAAAAPAATVMVVAADSVFKRAGRP